MGDAPHDPHAAAAALLTGRGRGPIPMTNDPELSPEAQNMMKVIALVESINRTISTKLSSAEFYDQVVARLLNSDVLKPILEEMIVAALHKRPLEAAPQFGLSNTVRSDDGPNVIGYKALVYLQEPEENESFKVAVTGPDHPLYPSDFDCFRPMISAEGRRWISARNDLTAFAADAIKTALTEERAMIGVFYYAVLYTITDRPTDAPAEPLGTKKD